MKVELAILNYNGRHHLEHLLPTAIREAHSYGLDCRVVVIDNQSPADDAAWVRENYSGVEVWVAPRNEYLFSYNEYAKQSAAEVLVLLNNDLKLCKDFLPPLLRHFDSQDVFAVSAASKNWDGDKCTFGPMLLKHHHGDYYWNPDYERQINSHTLFCSGGFMAVEREKFLKLGGFSPLYYPAYTEDVDLCFRAWRKGWRCLYEPQSVVLHREHGSWDSLSGSKVDRLMLRGRLLFSWSTLPRSVSLYEEYCYFLYKSAFKLLHGEIWFIKIFLGTWCEWKKIHDRYSDLKISLEELRQIQKSLSIPIEQFHSNS
jgi:GT2 family glycosyltransferase